MSNLGRMMVGDKENGRRADDFYPTPREAVEAFLRVEGQMLRSHLGPGEKVWEPACGDGRLAGVLMAAGFDVTGSDLRERGWGEGGIDFLALGPRAARSGVIVTNPPFSLAEDFIVQAKRLGARYLALLLKATYWHAGGRVALWRSWPPAAVYPIAWRVDFTGGGSSTMDVAWCVWRSHSAGQRGATYFPLRRPPAGNLFSTFQAAHPETVEGAP